MIHGRSMPSGSHGNTFFKNCIAWAVDSDIHSFVIHNFSQYNDDCKNQNEEIIIQTYSNQLNFITFCGLCYSLQLKSDIDYTIFSTSLQTTFLKIKQLKTKKLLYQTTTFYASKSIGTDLASNLAITAMKRVTH